MECLIILVAIAFIPALIARNRENKNTFGVWWLYGFLLFPIAFIHSILCKPGGKICPHCKELVKKEAVVCKHCHKEIITKA